MEVSRARMSYSYIGDFIDIINNEQRLKNMLLDYEFKKSNEILPDKREISVLLFNKKNVVIKVNPFRIDYEFEFQNAEQEDLVVFEQANNFFKLFGEIFYEIKAQRIALVITAFSDNFNNNSVFELTNKLNVSSVFGSCCEFSFKINGIKQYKEQLNSVLVCEMGKAKNVKLNQEKDVMLYRIDVNTMFANRQKRFEPANFSVDFADLYAEAEERLITLQNL